MSCMLFQGLYSSLRGDECCFMVVFQYGSVVLFNVRDHEIDGYLKLVEGHASGLLPDTRKDGEFSTCLSVISLCYEEKVLFCSLMITVL